MYQLQPLLYMPGIKCIFCLLYAPPPAWYDRTLEGGGSMNLAKNLPYLRRLHGKMTQELLAQHMNVSRQTVSKWESGSAFPDMDKLMALSEIFSCSIDMMVKEDLSQQSDYFSELEFVSVPAFTLGRYVVISPHPEEDVRAYLCRWAEKSGLYAYCRDPKMYGWDFPFVSMEQQSCHGLRGYMAGWVLPEGFETDFQGVERYSQQKTTYAKITIYDPYRTAYDCIPKEYKRIMEERIACGMKSPQECGYLPCFQEVYEKNGGTYMDIFLHADSIGKGTVHTGF